MSSELGCTERRIILRLDGHVGPLTLLALLLESKNRATTVLLGFKAMNERQWASRLWLEMVDEVIPQLPPLYPQAELLEHLRLLGVMASMPPSNFLSSCILSTASSSALALKKASEIATSPHRIFNAVQWRKPFKILTLTKGKFTPCCGLFLATCLVILERLSSDTVRSVNGEVNPYATIVLVVTLLNPT